MSILFYKRPDYVKRPPGPLDGSSCQRIVEKTHANKNSIPESIAFDCIIEERSLPPCSLSDFMDFLVYISHDAENLQFFLWYRDYTKRFNALDEVERMFSPEWKPALLSTHLPSLEVAKSSTEPTNRADEATAMEAHVRRNQPFRDEIEKMISHYLLLSSPRELNLSHRDRVAVLYALKQTTHPSALTPVVTLVESTLRNQLHPNFVRWTICNGNRPKVIFVRGMGTFFTTVAITMTIVLCLSHVSRWWRIFCFIPYMMGICILTAAYKGLCILLHHNGNQRSIRPWEDLTVTTDKASRDSLGSDLEPALSSLPPTAEAVRPTSSSSTLPISEKEKSDLPKSKWLNTFGSKNKFDDESWIQRWKSRPLFQRVMEPTTRVHEAGVRIMQDRIVKQSQFWGLIGATFITIVVVAMPRGNRF